MSFSKVILVTCELQYLLFNYIVSLPLYVLAQGFWNIKSADVSSDPPNFIVESVLKKEEIGGKLYYLVKWKDYFETWEQAEDLNCPELILEYENRNNPKQLPKVDDMITKSVTTEPEKELKPEEKPMVSCYSKTMSKSKTSMGMLKDCLLKTLQIPEEVTKKPDRVIKSGFNFGLMPERILISYRKSTNGELCVLLKWKGVNRMELVPACLVNERCPDLIAEFYRTRPPWDR